MAKRSKITKKVVEIDQLFIAAAAVFFSAVVVVMLISRAHSDTPADWLKELQVLGTSTSADQKDFDTLTQMTSRL